VRENISIYMNDKQAQYNKKSRLKHLEERRQYDRERYKVNKERWEQYYLDNRDERLGKCKAYKKTTKGLESLRKSTAKQLKKPEVRLAHNLRCRVYRALKGAVKSAALKDILGCTMGELRTHLESQFQPGMTWDNYGEWHLDHIMPVDSFCLINPIEQRQCFHYTNLQPLWAKENIIKSNKTEAPQECGEPPL
jgi:hypothetical protein